MFLSYFTYFTYYIYYFYFSFTTSTILLSLSPILLLLGFYIVESLFNKFVLIGYNFLGYYLFLGVSISDMFLGVASLFLAISLLCTLTFYEN